jgi:hypothetical protein
MLTLNRGEGGQNLMSADFDDALGLIRTQELLAADRYMAVDQFFGTEVDFGFSKTKEEAFAKWTHERVLYDAVRCVRLYRPLVIASVFIGGPSDGHGQHQVAGEIAQKVFNAAGDPNVFPDQIAAGLQPWQPLKVYARVPFARIDAQGIFDSATGQYTPARFTNYVTGKVTTTIPTANVVVPEGTTDTLLGGLSYVQFARQGLALQKTQIGNNTRLAPAGRFDVSYHRYGSHLNQPDGDDSGLEPSVFDGIDTSFAGITSLISSEDATKNPPSGLSAQALHGFLEKIDAQLANAQEKFDPNNPELIAPQLREALHSLGGAIQELQDPKLNYFSPLETYNLLRELRIKRVQLNNALILAYGIKLDATSENYSISAWNAAPTTAVISAEVDHSCVLNRMWLENSAGATFEEPRIPGSPATAELTSKPTAIRLVAANKNNPFDTDFTNDLTKPYFYRKDVEQPVYDLLVPTLRNAPQSPPGLTASASASCEGTTLQLSEVAHNPGDERQRVYIVPNLDILLSPRVKVLPTGTHTFTLTAIDNSFASRAYLTDLCLPTGCITGSSHEGKEIRSKIFQISLPKQLWDTSFEVNARGFSADQPNLVTKPEGYRAVGYPGLTYTNYYTPATARIVPVDVHTAPSLNIAYLPGTGDDLPASIEDLGIHAHILTLADLTPATLAPYDAVILGVRAYAAHPELAGPGSRALLDYATNGGVVLLQYMTARFGDAEAPFPISVPGDPAHNVVDEAQPVTLLAPDSPLLTWPNRITPADFDQWIEERGHGFAASWAQQYTPLLEVHDPGQPPQQGGLLVAHTGKGLYIYCALALYRQLPEGVPGAYRLLANLISAAKNPAFNSAPAK